MKSRIPFFRRLLNKILPRRVHAPARLPRQPEMPRRGSGIEPLEGRIAPASLLNATTISFNDLDGDVVTVKFSKPLFDPAKTIAENKLNDVFKFSNGATAVPFENAGPQQLQLADLTKVSTIFVNGGAVNPAGGTSVTITAVKGAGAVGNDTTNVGAIKATGLSLNAVSIEGDLGQIDVGTAASKVALRSLTVGTLGKFGATTQVAGTSAADALESRITGKLRTLLVQGDVSGYLHAVNGTGLVNNQPTTTAPAKIVSATIGGSLRGNPAAGASSNNTGTIESAGSIGTVSVLALGDDVGLVGGGGLNSGSIVGKNIGSVLVKGALVGGGGTSSGSVIATGKLSSVAVGSVVSMQPLGGQPPTTAEVGGLNGGAGAASGSVQAGKTLASAAIIGGIAGGAGDGSGVVSSGGTMGVITISGDVTGNGPNSGGVSAGGDLTSLVVTGKLTGGSSTHSGFVEGLKNIGFVKFTGDITGGSAANAGSIVATGDLAKVVIGGKLIGGSAANTGSIFAGTDPFGPGALKVVKVKGGVLGGSAVSAGSIISEGALGRAVIGTGAAAANLTGGSGDFSGGIFAAGSIESVTINGGAVGGDGDYSGSIRGYGAVAAVSIAGSLRGAAGESSGSVVALDESAENGLGRAGDLGIVTIGVDIAGGGGARSGRVSADGNLATLTTVALKSGAGAGSGAIETGLGSIHRGDALAVTLSGGVAPGAGGVSPGITIGGRLAAFSAGAGLLNATLRVGDDLGLASITGNVTGSTISARGQTAPSALDFAIGALKISGTVSDSSILAGYNLDGNPVNADASVALLKVGGDWIASDLTAGVKDTASNGFGNVDDSKITGGRDKAARISQIGKVVVKGAVSGTAAAGDHFGFVAQHVASFKHGGTKLALDPAIPSQTFELGANGDVTVREVGV